MANADLQRAQKEPQAAAQERQDVSTQDQTGQKLRMARPERREQRSDRMVRQPELVQQPVQWSKVPKETPTPMARR